MNGLQTSIVMHGCALCRMTLGQSFGEIEATDEGVRYLDSLETHIAAVREAGSQLGVPHDLLLAHDATKQSVSELGYYVKHFQVRHHQRCAAYAGDVCPGDGGRLDGVLLGLHGQLGYVGLVNQEHTTHQASPRHGDVRGRRSRRPGLRFYFGGSAVPDSLVQVIHQTGLGYECPRLL